MERGEGERISRFLAVVGPSGSGKSSVVKAGLIPALADGKLPGSERWFVVEMLPGNYPLDKLEVALMKVAANQSANIRQQLERDERGLLRVADLILPDDGSELVLVIDQFEEVFTLLEDEGARQQFLKLVYTAVTEPRSRVRVIVTLRADYYDRPLRYAEFGDLLRSRMETVLPLSAKELERAISGPAERVGVAFEEGLVASIVSETIYQAGALPLLEFALTELFERRSGRVLTHAAYQDIGGAAGALAKQAEAAYQELDAAGQETARQLFLRLVTLGEGAEDTRRRAARSELLAISDSTMDDIIDAYAEYRLLSLDHDPATRGPMVELAHEALLREWKRLREWLDASREDIRMERQLAGMSADWTESNRDASLLARGSRLEQFERWAKETELALTPGEREFLAASVSERERQAAAETARQTREKGLERRSVTFLRALVVVLLLAVLGAFGLTAVAVNQSQIAQAERDSAQTERDNAQAEHQRAEVESRIAQTRELVGYATDRLDSDPDLATLLAIQAVNVMYPVDGHPLPEADTILHRAVQAFNGPLPVTSNPEHHPFTAWVLPVFSPDGSEIATAISDFDHPLITKIWDAASRQLLFTMPGNTLFAPWIDQTLTTIDHDAQNHPVFTHWDMSSRQGARQLASVTIPVDMWPIDTSKDIFISSNFTFLVLGTGPMTLWDLRTGQQVDVPPLHNMSDSDVGNVSWDGSRFIIFRQDQASSVYDTTTWAELFTLPASDVGGGAIFSQDSKRIETGGSSNNYTWDATTGDLISTLPAHPTPLTINADGTRLAERYAADADDILIWDIASKQSIVRLHGPGGDYTSFSFSPDGTRFIAMMWPSGDTYVWNLTAGNEVRTMVNDPLHEVNTLTSSQSVAYSPDGQRLVTTNNNATPIVWDAITGHRLLTLSALNTQNWDAVWSPDGTRIAISAGYSRSVNIVDSSTGQALLTLSLSPGSIIYSVAYSPDGTKIATTGSSPDSKVRLWDSQTGQQLQVFDTSSSATVWDVAFSPDGTRIAAAGNSEAWIWDSVTGQQLLKLTGFRGPARSIAFSPDGQQLVTAGYDHQVKNWDAQTGELVRTMSGHTGTVTSVTYSLDGAQIASASRDGTVRLWDANTGESLLTLYGASEGVGDVAFSPDGTRLATQNFDGTTRIYALPIPDLIALAQSRLTRSLTTDECQRYLHVDTCPAQPPVSTPAAEATVESTPG